MGRAIYLGRSIQAQFSPSRFNCPNCNGKRSRLIDRKYLVTQLRRCESCLLMFRTPTDRPAVNEEFYETEYAQGFTTDMPSPAVLVDLKRTNFTGTEKDYSYYIGVLGQLGLKSGARLFDYGCSWGYGSYQLKRAGYDVTSFEVAPSRRRFAIEQLEVRGLSHMDQAVAGEFDCFFSAHVIEHVPSPQQVFDQALRLLRPGGLFVSFTPNGSEACRAVNVSWSSVWGEVHPNYIDDVFLDRSFSSSRRSVGSSPVVDAALPAEAGLMRLDKLDRGELFFVAQK